MSMFKPEQGPATPAPNSGDAAAVTAAPKPIQPIEGSKPRRRPMTPTMLGSETVPQGGNVGGKSLIGQ
jgi:hypothetical protein